MSALTVAVLRESAPGEQRVALVPDGVARLRSANLEVLIEAGAGAAAHFSDDDYAKAGAVVVTQRDALAAGIVLTVGTPSAENVRRLRPGQTVIGMLEPRGNPALVTELARGCVTAISLDCLPRTLSRAQSMDALSSQASISGYKAVLIAANAFQRYFPMFITPAGTAPPARVLVLGAGIAGLQAIATARRLGAVVTAYDVRPETRLEVESLGARSLVLDAPDGSGVGGYARALTAAEEQIQRGRLAEYIAAQDIVIATAQVPGRRPPLLVTGDAVKSMAAGSVIVDVAASPRGGNVELSAPDATVVTENGVTVVGTGNLPATMPVAASLAYSRNITALLAYLVRDGALVIDPSDEIQAGVLITHGGAVVHPAMAGLPGGDGKAPR